MCDPNELYKSNVKVLKKLKQEIIVKTFFE